MMTTINVLKKEIPQHVALNDHLYAKEPSSLEDKLDKIVGQVAEFVALYESASHKIERHEVATGHRFTQSEVAFNHRLESIDKRLLELEGMLTHTGVARWRLASEETLREGKAHLQELRKASETLLERLDEGCERLTYLTEKAAAQINEASKILALDELKDLTDRHSRRIEERTEKVMTRLTQTSSWFQWQRVVSTVVAVMLSGMLFSLFTNDQWPWETHRQIAMERQAGKAFLQEAIRTHGME